jgi:DNA-binding SARP family transcriptional activator/TolB-like protein
MLQLQTLGTVRLQGVPEGALTSRRKQIALLAYLASRGRRPTQRSTLMALLWEDRDDARARQSLRQALLELKRILGDALQVEGESVSVDPAAVTLDVAAIERALDEGRLAEGVRSWQGDFLAGMEDVGGESFRAWLEAEREALRRRLRRAFGALTQSAGEAGNWSLAVEWAERWTDAFPLDEEAHQRLVEGLSLSGRQAAALDRHAAFTARLHSELGVAPSAKFLELASGLKRIPTPARRTPSPGSAALFTPDLVGRAPALAELADAWAEVKAGGTVAVLIEADAGMGKTRLAQEFVRRLEEATEPPVILRARPRDAGAPASLGAARELLENLAAAPGLAGASTSALTALAGVVPGIMARFPSLPRDPPVPASGELERALAEALGAIADERAIVLMLDDFASADPASRRLVTDVLARRSRRVLFLATAPLEEPAASAALHDLRSLPWLRRLKLTPLTVPDLELLLATMLELDPAERHELAALLHDEGGGNPFYAVEMVSALVDEGALRVGAGGVWQLSRMDGRPLPLPDSLRDAIVRRLSSLTAEARAAGEAAAILGGTVEDDLLAEVAEVDSATIESALGELIGRRLMHRVAGDPPSYEFTHELVARVTAERLPADRRRRLHRTAARALRSRRSRPGAQAAARYHAERAASRRIRSWRSVGVAGVAAALLALGGIFLGLGAERRATLGTLLTRRPVHLEPNRIVVAPLVNLTGDTTLVAVGDMAADWIARGLTQTTEFEVVDPRTAWITARLVTRIPRLLRPAELAVAIAQETGAGLVLSGRYYREGDSLRFEVQVTDVASHKLTRALDPIRSPLKDPTSVIPILARRAMGAVATATDTVSVGLSAAMSQPPSYLAYDEMSHAWEDFFRDDTTDLFARTARAQALDTGYMTPRLMEAYVRSVTGGWALTDSLVKVVELRRNRLTPADAAVLDGLEANLRGDRPGRVRAARELARLTPGSFEGYTLLAEMALSIDQPREALAALAHVNPDRGLLLFSPIYWQTSARALHELGQYRAELEAAQNGVRRFPAEIGTQVALLRAYAALGLVEQLGKELDRRLSGDVHPVMNDQFRLLFTAAELRAHNQAAVADRLLERMTASGTPAAEDSTADAERLPADLLYEAGHWERAGQAYAALYARHPDDIAALGGVGASAARQADLSEARRVDSVLAAWRGRFAFGRNSYARARIAAVLGDSSAAVPLLQLAFREGYPMVPVWDRSVHLDRDFKGIRNYPPFRSLMGLP